MQEIVRVIVGIIVLALGVPIGNFLAKWTKEELKTEQIWFKLLITVSLILGFIGLIIKNDVLLFSFFFIAIVASRSLIRKNVRKL